MILSILISLLAFLFFFEGNALFANTVPLIDYEEYTQDFVLETKRIIIPGFEEAFNPSIIRIEGTLLMCFRFIPDSKQKYTSYFGVVWLDDGFNPISEPQVLNIRETGSVVPSRADDSRLVQVGETVYFIYSDNPYPKMSRAGFRVYVAELHCDDGVFVLKNKECLSQFDGESPNLREKNWVPFCYENHLLLAYSIDPHTIFYPLFGTSACATIAKTSQNIKWPWGSLKGGTQAQLMGDKYLAFFHTWTDIASAHSQGKKESHYFMGAYTFSPEPPFEITDISPFPIVGKNFYHGIEYTPYWKPIRCVFPAGFIYDKDFIWVTYGRQDHELWVVKLNKQKLLKSLIKTTNSQLNITPLIDL